MKLSDAGPSPVLEAHPGSPVDLSTARRPSLAASLASSSSRSYGSVIDISRCERLPNLIGKKEEGLRRDGVAAKENISVTENDENSDRETMRPPRRQHVSGVQPFYIPAKVPENEEVQITTTSVHGDDRMSVDTAMNDIDMDFHFETDGGMWISANPIANESRSSLATNTTTSTLMDDRYSHGALTVDTSVASSAASMMSSSASTYSASTNVSDIYGWEEELDRKSSIEHHGAWEREMARRLPSGGRTVGPRIRGSNELQYKRGDGKRKSLLYRVLNLSGRRGSEDSNASFIPPEGYPYPATSA